MPKKLNTEKRTNSKIFVMTSTKKRLKVRSFFSITQKKDKAEKINEEMPNTQELLDKIDWQWMANGIPSRFHGDFHFENILWCDEKKTFVFLDWRQDFGGSLNLGDIYYDLAKLLHGLIVSHSLINESRYNVEWSGSKIEFRLDRTFMLVEIERVFENWLLEEGYSLKKVRILTALIFLNIAPLHHPYNLLLFSLGKSMLKLELENK